MPEGTISWNDVLKNGAPFEQLLEPRSARSGRSFFLGYHALGLRHNRLVTVLVEVRHEVHAALVCREQKVLAVELIAHDFLMHAIRQIVNRAIGSRGRYRHVLRPHGLPGARGGGKHDEQQDYRRHKRAALADAVNAGKAYLTGALAAGFDMGKGSGPVNHMWQY